MIRYALQRLVLAVPTLLIAGLLVFLLIRLVPGDPALLLVGDLGDPAALEQARRDLGLDRPLPEQFLRWLGGVAGGDLGRSVTTGEPVLAMILERFPVSAQVVLAATLLAALVAIPAGTVAAWRQDGPFDHAAVGLAVLGLSVPSFWSGLLILILFGVTLGWLPTIGYVSPAEDLAANLAHIAMPVAALALTEVATLLRMTRAATLEVMRLDYVTHARAKGLSDAAVLSRHVFPNAFGPTLTVLGLILGHLLGGIVVLEKIFGLPGMGRLLVDAIFQRDYPVVQGCLLFIAFVYVGVNLLVDLLYPLFDPRVRP
ncbi:MAG TPA: ABC transporter permease [Azospirillaceae bacterium]|nr:ABC transporter permease [Azospirillaceae bacterium]